MRESQAVKDRRRLSVGDETCVAGRWRKQQDGMIGYEKDVETPRVPAREKREAESTKSIG